MPQVLITRTLGPNVVAGTVRTLTGTAIRQLCAEHGDDWYQPTYDSARQRAAAQEQGHTALDAGLADGGRRRGRERQGAVI
jgi:hypothetical protein